MKDKINKNPHSALYKRITRMIDTMCAHPDVLEETQLEWVQKIAETAAQFDHFEGYTPRQCEVITGIYKAYKIQRSPKNKISKVDVLETDISKIDVLKSEILKRETSKKNFMFVEQKPSTDSSPPSDNIVIQGDFGTSS